MPNASKTNEYPTIADLFCLLDRWRHLPAYQFERRADIFFALFLPEVLGAHLSEKNCSVEINPTLIPEFPIKNKGNNGSKKADYLALSTDRKRAFLVELKTDMDSIEKKQCANLHEAADEGLKKLVMGILDICGSPHKDPKYVYLLKLLSEIGLIEYEDGLFPPKGKEYRKALNRIKGKVEKKEDWPCLKVVYIQPRLPPDAIDFKEFADAIEKGEGGGIRSLFADYLRKWATDDAGTPNPKDWHPC